jgi:hypothetical protein
MSEFDPGAAVFEALASRVELEQGGEAAAPTRLKSRLYTALINRQQESGPLASLSQSKAGGRGLCVFEQLVHIAPISDRKKAPFFCRGCHARWLGEHWENAPIYWGHCPYVEFQKP